LGRRVTPGGDQARRFKEGRIAAQQRWHGGGERARARRQAKRLVKIGSISKAVSGDGAHEQYVRVCTPGGLSFPASVHGRPELGETNLRPISRPALFSALAQTPLLQRRSGSEQREVQRRLLAASTPIATTAIAKHRCASRRGPELRPEARGIRRRARQPAGATQRMSQCAFWPTADPGMKALIGARYCATTVRAGGDLYMYFHAQRAYSRMAAGGLTVGS